MKAGFALIRTGTLKAGDVVDISYRNGQGLVSWVDKGVGMGR